MIKTDQYFMDKAVEQALKAFSKNEVPIGAVLVDHAGQIVANGYNLVEHKKTQLAHAELIVLQTAAKKINSWRLDQMTLYVTVQPCMMCLGALYLSRISRVVYGTVSPKFGMSVDRALTRGIYKNLSMKLELMEYKKAKEIVRLFFQKKRSMKHVQKSGSRENKKGFIDSKARVRKRA